MFLNDHGIFYFQGMYDCIFEILVNTIFHKNKERPKRKTDVKILKLNKLIAVKCGKFLCAENE